MFNRAFARLNKPGATFTGGKTLFRNRFQSMLFSGDVDSFGIKKYKLTRVPELSKFNIPAVLRWPVIATTAGSLERE